ncbi:MAG TPA: hypothetical protein VMV60_16940, partial [Thermoanaerobaculia bacterium]|nr:hypothetical protein [Thermoanaerobaculia bacterium]
MIAAVGSHENATRGELTDRESALRVCFGECRDIPALDAHHGTFHGGLSVRCEDDPREWKPWMQDDGHRASGAEARDLRGGIPFCLDREVDAG